MNELTAPFIVLILVVLCSCVSYGVGSIVKEAEFQKQAIELGFAHYNATNGVWQWNTNQVTR